MYYIWPLPVQPNTCEGTAPHALDLAAFDKRHQQRKDAPGKSSVFLKEQPYRLCVGHLQFTKHCPQHPDICKPLRLRLSVGLCVDKCLLQCT